jgi:hypothetical protein
VDVRPRVETARATILNWPMPSSQLTSWYDTGWIHACRTRHWSCRASRQAVQHHVPHGRLALGLALGYLLEVPVMHGPHHCTSIDCMLL